MIGLYQLCRAIANLLIPLFGKVVYHILGRFVVIIAWRSDLLRTIFHFKDLRDLLQIYFPLLPLPGVSIGLTGFALNSSDLENTKAIFYVAVAMIGLSEVITCMQHYVKVEYVQFGVPVFRQRLRLQYGPYINLIEHHS